jgi:hypothetical protein
VIARREDGTLVAVVSSAPLVGEALAASLESLAEVRWFPSGRGDTAGLLDSLRPDAVVVDSEEEARAATPFARTSRAPLVYVMLEERKVRFLRNGGWEEPAKPDISPEGIRNLLVGRLFGRERTG